jgi:hypothetical protein
MNKRIFLGSLCFFLAACQIFSSGSKTINGNDDPVNQTAASPIDNENSTQQAKPQSGPTVAPLSADQPFVPFTKTTLKEWKESPYTVQGDTLPVTLEGTRNPPVVAGLTQEERNFLAAQGFVVIQSSEEQFGDIRTQVSSIYGQPYYLTTDAAFHALHLTFDEMLKLLEKDVLQQEAIDITQTILDQVSSYASKSKGTGLEPDAQLAEAYLAVALQLFQGGAEYREDLAQRIKPQIDQIMAGQGRAKSALIPGFEDDYGAYKPVGHYAGDPKLENYFRGMTWLGRVAFKYKDLENPEFTPTRAPLIITYALRHAEKANSPVLEKYTKLMETLSFLIGPTDDGGPNETGALMDAVYGKDASLEDLSDGQKWQIFLNSVDKLPSPRINSTFVNTTISLNAERSWRLMGQRFTLDGLIFQNMIFDKVGSDDKKREFPSGLDVMAALGSTASLQAQQTAGETDYKNYNSQLEKMQKAVQSQPQQEWLDTFYSGWLYAFIPQVQPKNGNYPPLMGTKAWQNRETTSALGSWAELKHDTALYVKMPELMGGGGPPASPSAPAYVEPNPNVFYRLSYVANAIYEGLQQRGYPVNDSKNYSSSGGDLILSQLWEGMGNLAKVYESFGDIAVKEIQGQSLTTEDYDLIQSPLGPVEYFANYGKVTGQDIKMPPVPVIAAVSGGGNDVLQAGVGKVDRIYVVVPIDGKLAIAQGGVFTFYEFKQPRSNRLTDEDWVKRLSSNPPDMPPYTTNYILPGGKPVNALAFRAGDVYIVTEKGGTPPLNMRGKPSKFAPVVASLKKDTYIEIMEGPEKADGLVWWKVKVFGSEATGWVAENPEWYDRAHGQ